MALTFGETVGSGAGLVTEAVVSGGAAGTCVIVGGGGTCLADKFLLWQPERTTSAVAMQARKEKRAVRTGGWLAFAVRRPSGCTIPPFCWAGWGISFPSFWEMWEWRIVSPSKSGAGFTGCCKTRFFDNNGSAHDFSRADKPALLTLPADFSPPGNCKFPSFSRLFRRRHHSQKTTDPSAAWPTPCNRPDPSACPAQCAGLWWNADAPAEPLRR